MKFESRLDSSFSRNCRFTASSPIAYEYLAVAADQFASTVCYAPGGGEDTSVQEGNGSKSKGYERKSGYITKKRPKVGLRFMVQ